MGLIQRGGSMKAKALGNLKMRTVEKQIASNVQIGSQLITDDFLSYSQISKLYPHEIVKHSQKEYSGMTLLVWFATHASERDILDYMYFIEVGGKKTARSREEAKYAYARAMIEARPK